MKSRSLRINRFFFFILFYIMGIHIFLIHEISALDFQQSGLDGATTKTIYVPDDYPTIQEAIDAALDGDAVTVKPDIYYENINFNGKNITLCSLDPTSPTVVQETIITYLSNSSTVAFSGDEGSTCVLSGFTLSSGICGNNAKARISHNIIKFRGIQGCNGTIAYNTIKNVEYVNVALKYCNGLIANNIIHSNSIGLTGCNGRIINNTIYGNQIGIEKCAGVIRNCIVWGNETNIKDSSVPSFSCIQYWNEGGDGNTCKNPRFADQENKDFHLKSSSPCNDAGAMVEINRDFEGDQRGFHSIGWESRGDGSYYDMGADEFMGIVGKPLPRIIYIPDDYTIIQDAIENAPEGSEIIVSPGIYSQKVEFLGENIILRSTDPTSYSIVANTQIIDYGVTFSGEEGTTCVLTGFTIRNHWTDIGAGIHGHRTKATIKNNIIRNNYCNDIDGIASGIFQCDGLIEGNIICNNGSDNVGAGISECHGIIRRNLIEKNTAYWEVTFWDEDYYKYLTLYFGDGAGIYDCDGVIVNNIIRYNKAMYSMGLIYCDGRIENNLIYGNRSEEPFGYPDGVAGLINCKAAIKNNVIFNNTSNISLLNCTGPIDNCIIWWNSRENGSQLKDCSVPKYCCIEDWSGGGEGNISTSPLFNDQGDSPFTLDDTSPCIDSGSPDEKDNDACLPLGKGLNRNDIGAYGGPENCGWDIYFMSTPTPTPTPTPTNTPTSTPTITPTPTPTYTPTPLPPTIIHVPEDTGTIQEAIDISWNGDIVIVSSGLYMENLYFNGKNITLRSIDPQNKETVEDTIIDGNASGPVITFSGTENESCVLSGFTITNGKALYYDGGGITGNFTKATIQYNIITHNYHQYSPYPEENQGAGGIFMCNGIIRNNRIIKNNSNDSIGGINECDGIIYGNLISQNSKRGIYNSGALIFNNTIVDNGVNDIGQCHGLVFNCIINYIQVWDNNSSSNVYYCLTNSRYPLPGRGNIQADPLFVDPVNHDYRLRNDSPCIDKGNTFLLYLKDHLTDLDGNCRIAGSAVDIGCFEYGSDSDMDGDLLDDIEEMNYGTNPLDNDTDDDGLQDGIEVLRGTNPYIYDSPEGILIPEDFDTIQEGIFLAFPKETIRVEPQIYNENLLIPGKDIKLQGMDPYDEDIVTSTILAGGCFSSVVHFIGSETSDCMISGFTITEGSAFRGGGICGNGTHASILCNHIIRNTVWYILVYFDDEWDESYYYYLGYGGGLWKCNGSIENNLISYNSAYVGGGGLYDCDGMIRNNQIMNNQSLSEIWSGGGGGLSSCDNIIADNLISNNSSTTVGGGIHLCDGPIIKNRISDNRASSFGGGISYSDGLIANNIIWNNEARNGGGLYACGGVIANCTIWGNTAQGLGGGIWESGPIMNCILWNNKYTDMPSYLHYSCIPNWPWKDENILIDPKFISPDTGDFHLQPSSPCIDAGNPDPQWNDGSLPPGMGDVRCDMGAYGGPYNAYLVAVPIEIIDHILGKKELTPEQVPLVDKNKDGIIDICDLITSIKSRY